jgi:hypothetical protein
MVVILPRLLAGLLLAGLLAALLRPALAEKKRLHHLRSAVLTLQRGLQGYLVEKEHYPMLQEAKGSDLAEFLAFSGHLPAPPPEPWLNAVRYRSEGDFKGFTLTALAADGRRVLFTLDHQSAIP